MVDVATAGQWVLLVGRERVHLGGELDRELSGLVGFPLSEEAHRPVERRSARQKRIIRVGLRGGEQGLIGGGIIAAAVFGHAEGQQAPRSMRSSSRSFAPARPRASTASSSALSVDGRILHAIAAHAAVHLLLVPLANVSIRCRVAASSFSCPNHAWRAATFRESRCRWDRLRTPSAAAGPPCP